MHLQRRIKLASIISQYAETEFERGQNDCNTFFLDVHDKMYGTCDREEVVGKYDDLKSGIRYLKKKVKLSPHQWMMARHYAVLRDRDVKVGDVALIEHRGYATAFIYSDGAWWTMLERTGGLNGVSTPDMLLQATSVWRKTHG